MNNANANITLARIAGVHFIHPNLREQLMAKAVKATENTGKMAEENKVLMG